MTQDEKDLQQKVEQYKALIPEILKECMDKGLQFCISDFRLDVTKFSERSFLIFNYYSYITPSLIDFSDENVMPIPKLLKKVKEYANE